MTQEQLDRLNRDGRGIYGDAETFWELIFHLAERYDLIYREEWE